MPAAGARNAQREITAEREAADRERPRREFPRDRADGADDFVDAAGMKDVGVEMMRLAVVAEIQAKHVETFAQKAHAGVEHVVGSRAAFPPVKQDDEAARSRRLPLRRMETLQAHAVTAVEHVFGCGGFDVAAAKAQQPAAQPARGEHGLDVRIAQQQRRMEVGSVHSSP